MLRANISYVLKLAAVYAAASVAGALAAWIAIPLPWMIGPLVATAALYLGGLLHIPVPVRIRPIGQGIVATQVGFYFTPLAFAATIENGALLIGMAITTLVLGLLIGLLLSRITGQPLPWAMIATLPTSPVEASIIAERHGMSVPIITFTQTFRTAAVVILMPMAIYMIDHPVRLAPASAMTAIDLPGLAFVIICILAGALLFRLLRISNPNFLGPLAVIATLTAMGFSLAHFPKEAIWAAQVILGTWLGSTFRPEVLRGTGKLVAATIFTTLVFIGLAAGVALGLSRVTGLGWETLILGTAPGGVTEMALTASYLGSEVALVTAFQLTRIFIIVPLIPALVQAMDRMDQAGRA